MGQSPKGMRLGGKFKGKTDRKRQISLREREREQSADVRGQSGIMTGLDWVSKLPAASGCDTHTLYDNTLKTHKHHFTVFSKMAQIKYVPVT